MKQTSDQLLVKYPLNKGSIVGSLLLAIIILISLIIPTSKSTISLSLQLFALVMCGLSIGPTIWWWKQQPYYLFLNKDQIIAGDTAFRLDSIEKIVIRGSSIGIKLKQKRIVPPQLCVALLDKKNGIQALKKWAEHQQIKVVYGSFLRWF